jgi:hypothetical protein
LYVKEYKEFATILGEEKLIALFNEHMNTRDKFEESSEEGQFTDHEKRNMRDDSDHEKRNMRDDSDDDKNDYKRKRSTNSYENDYDNNDDYDNKKRKETD